MLMMMSTAAHAQIGVESPDAIRNAALSFVRAHLPAQSSGLHIHLDGPASGIHFPRCTKLKVSYFGYSNPYGNQTIKVLCQAPSNWQIYLPVQVQVDQAVVIAARPLTAGSVIQAGDLAVVRRNTSGLSGSAIRSPQAVIGKVLRFGTLAGQPITTGMLNAPDVVHAGEQVTLYAEGDGIRIATIADAIENGRPGQNIMVRNLQSGRIIRGTVTAQGHVVVNF
ncbi:flagellar basal body P-ring formation chaperone FlgA [Acidithiobacillus marinus]|nr:flagellar basal body P-ring formation chaperone FlgA [Acidithiobacillus marinus]